MARPLLDTDQAAEYLGTNPRHIRLLIERRELPYTKVGRLNRFDPDDLDQYKANNRIEAL